MNRLGIKARSGIGAALVALMVLALVPGVAAAATRPITFTIFMGDSCVRGRASDNGMFDFAWLNANGGTKYAALVQAGPDGRFSICPPQARIVEAGDRLMTHDGSALHELVVPGLTGFGNRVRDIYKGRGPANQYIKLICSFSGGFEPCQETWRVRVNSEGKWSLKPGWDVGPAETLVVQWKSPSGDFVRTYATPAILTVRIGSARVVGTTRTGGHPTVVLKRGPALDVKAMANPTASPLNGDFTGQLRNQAGNKVNVRPGDLISSSIAADLMWIVPAIQATGDASTDHVTGRCHYDDPSEVFSGDLQIFAYHNGEFVNRSSITDYYDDDGYFDVEMEFQAGDQLIVRCGMFTGDWSERSFTAI